jgi:hypothetical protein
MILSEKNPPELEQLLSSLEEISDQLQVSDLRWHFNLKLCAIDDTALPIAQLVKSAYPAAYPEDARIRKVSLAEMIETMNWWFCGGGISGREEHFRLRPIVTEYSDLFWRMSDYIDFSGSEISEYIAMNRDDIFGSSGILDNFAFVIVDRESQHVLFFNAGQSD